MARLKPLSVLVWGLGLIALGVAWSALAPTSLLGSATYLSTYGTSMLPNLHAGDLVIVRPAERYVIGDVVAYHNRILNGEIILHRVVAVDGARLVMKGDHNAFSDEYHPLPTDVVGKMWLQIGSVGDQIGRLRTSENAAVVFGVAGLFAAGLPTALGNWITGQRSRRRSKRDNRKRQGAPRAVSPELVTTFGALLAIAALGLIASLALSLFAKGQATTKAVGVDVQYSEVGSYSSSGTAPKGAVYPDGTFQSDDPVFLALARRIHIGFTYVLSSTEPALVSGTTSLTATIESANTGWRRTIVVLPETPFAGKTTSLAADLDIVSILQLAQAYDKAVGLHSDLLTLTLIADVKTHGNVAGAPISNEIAPKLPFHLDPTVLRLAAEGVPDVGASGQWTPAAANPATVEEHVKAFLNPVVNRQVMKHVTQPNNISVLGLSSSVADARRLSIVGIVSSSVAGILFLGLLALALRARDEPSRIQRRYGSQLVPVGRIAAIRGSSAVQVTSMASLVRLAQHYDRMILHEHQEGEHWYAVQDGDLFYFYRTRIGPHLPRPAAPEDSVAFQPREVR
jgi:signal peptidase I